MDECTEFNDYYELKIRVAGYADVAEKEFPELAKGLDEILKVMDKVGLICHCTECEKYRED